MIDRTTAGHEAEPEEVEAVLHNLCGYHLAEPDPLFRYNVLTREQALYDALVVAIKRERGRALAEITASGNTLTHVAQITNLGSRQRVQRLIAIARAAEAAAAEVQAASLAYEEKHAAGKSSIEDSGVASVVPAPVPVGRIGGDDDLLAPEDLSGPDDTADAAAMVGTAVAARDADADDAGQTVRDPAAVLEPTILMPALAAVLNPTKELPAGEGQPTVDDDVAWWRHRQDTGAA
jgi:hypothetical protein